MDMNNPNLEVARANTHVDEHGTIYMDGQDAVAVYRLLAIRGRLKLEVAGLRFKGASTTCQYVRNEFGFKGNKASVLAQFEAMLRERGILND